MPESVLARSSDSDDSLPNDTTYRASMAEERQRDEDARQAGYFRSTSELGAFDIEAVRELYKGAR